MSDVNKIVAAILASGRMQSIQAGARPGDTQTDGRWIEEYRAFLDRLQHEDDNEKQASDDRYTTALK